MIYVHVSVCHILQVVDFMVSLLQRACVGLGQASSPSLGNPVESQTLSMGMGLVATLLSAPQVLVAETYICYFMKGNRWL